MKNQNPILKSGFIPLYRKKNLIETVLMIPSNPLFGGTCPQFSKGTWEDFNITLEENAIKEAEEELGLIRENIIYIDFLVRQKNIFWFYGEISSKELKEFGFETKEVIWKELFECYEIIRESQRPVLVTLIKKLIQNYSNFVYYF
ncbi:MAG: NUDIX domain-containing protein [Candidatus Dojkabacteria bacterium]|nr:NUDIX domain-containing protein [Candidatus Dojkabacteria bacterium]